MKNKFADWGRKGGQATTAAKAVAAAQNGSMPVRPGRRPRGWPKGKPRKVLPISVE